MKNQATSPDSKAAQITKVNSNTICTLGDYERRCLERLAQGCCERRELDRYIGTTNAPEFIKQLRRKSLKITTSRVKGLNRDGRSIWWGKYCLDPSSREQALLMLGVRC